MIALVAGAGRVSLVAHKAELPKRRSADWPGWTSTVNVANCPRATGSTPPELRVSWIAGAPAI
jgi:hypothetical protein